VQLGNPRFLFALLALPLLAGFFIWSYQQRRTALHRFTGTALAKRLTPSVSLKRQIFKWFLFLVFLVFLIIALTRPRFGIKMEMVERRGVDVIVALDISKSMLARDITPNRFDRAKHEITKFIDLLKGDRVGLIVFAGESFVQCPLTLDYGAAKLFLDAVTTDWISLQGTALADAIEQADRAFKTKKNKSKVLLILSDGEDHSGDGVTAAKKAAANGIVIHTIGIGSQKGVPIPLGSSRESVVYKKDKAGNLVMTRLNPRILEQVARESGGRYFHAGLNLDLQTIYKEIAEMDEKELGTSRMAVYKEQYQIFLLIALVILLLEFFIPDRVRHKQQWKGRFN